MSLASLKNTWRRQKAPTVAKHLRSAASEIREGLNDSLRIKGLALWLETLAERFEEDVQITDLKKARLREIEAYFSAFNAAPNRDRGTLRVRGSFVYVLESNQGLPLYVGQSENLLSRVGTHLSSRARRRQVECVRWIECEDITEALRLERYLIGTLRPKWNKERFAYTYDQPELLRNLAAEIETDVENRPQILDVDYLNRQAFAAREKSAELEGIRDWVNGGDA